MRIDLNGLEKVGFHVSINEKEGYVDIDGRHTPAPELIELLKFAELDNVFIDEILINVHEFQILTAIRRMR